MSAAPTDSSPFSLADRITKPEASSNGMNADAQSFVPGKSSWADEVASPVDTNPPASIGTVGTEEKKPEEVKDGKMPQSIPQTDGAGEPLGGSSLHEPDYNVDVKLSDMQMDPNNPLFSVKTFEELGLYVIPIRGRYKIYYTPLTLLNYQAIPLSSRESTR
jgi:ATP-dependent RNA helicase DDX19/DBP5